MALNGGMSSTTENCTFKVTGSTWMGSMMSSNDVVEAPLNPNNIRPGFSILEGENPICLITDTCKRSVELPRSTKIRLTSKSVIPNVRIRASRCGCNIRLGSTRGKSDYLIYWAHAPTNQSEPDRAYLLSHGGSSKHSLSLSFRVIFFIEGFGMNIVDYCSRSNGSCENRGGWIQGCLPTFAT